MLLGQTTLLANSNFSPHRRTVFIVHGFTQSATSNVNAVLVPGLFNFFYFEDEDGSAHVSPFMKILHQFGFLFYRLVKVTGRTCRAPDGERHACP